MYFYSHSLKKMNGFEFHMSTWSCVSELGELKLYLKDVVGVCCGHNTRTTSSVAVFFVYGCEFESVFSVHKYLASRSMRYVCLGSSIRL